MPWDIEAYDAYTIIQDSLGFAGIYRLIGINSNQPDHMAHHDGFLRSRIYGGHATRHGPGRGMNVCKITRPHPWSQFADTPHHNMTEYSLHDDT
jgi:hypothetical protein